MAQLLGASIEVEDCPLYIKIEADRLKYTFYYGYSAHGMIKLVGRKSKMTAYIPAQGMEPSFLIFKLAAVLKNN
jgi:hypothetical protein